MKRIIHIIYILLSLTSFGQNSLNNAFFIDPTMKAELNDTINTIYCSSFINAWIEAKDLHGGVIQLDSNTLLLNQLNSIIDNNSISNKYLVARSGFIKDSIILKINHELEQKFHHTKVFSGDLNNNDIISYAYLKKELLFYSKIYQVFYDDRIIFNASDTVDFFGLRCPWGNPKHNRKIVIHDYKNNNDFILEIKTKDGLDQIFFAKILPDSSLESSYNRIIQRVNLNDTSFMVMGEKLKIPYINFSIEKDFEELINKRVLNKGFENYILKEAKQVIDFDLNENGISLESEGYKTEIWAIIESLPRQFLFDKPFFIVIKENDKNEPYFCIYIANSNFMRKL